MTTRSCSAAALALFALAGAVHAQAPKPDFPQDVPVSRNPTAAERAWALENPYVAPQYDTLEMPQGTLSCPGEYAPSEGIVLAWEGGSTLNTITAQMVAKITTVGQAKAYIVCDTAAVATTARSTCVAAGADTTRIFTVIRTADTIWLRDYGPRYTYEGDVRVIIDHTYNALARVNDNTVPIGFAAYRHHKLYTFPMVHGGGNYHLNSLSEGHYTRLVANENPSYSEAQINTLWQQFWGPTNIFHNPYRTSVDGTQHIDMWMQILADHKVVIADWPNNSGSIEDVISDDAAATMAAAGWEVTRLPNFSVSGTHYTYTNMVLCNRLALIPQYTAALTMPNPAGGTFNTAQINANALASYQAVLGPDYTVVGIPCQNIVTLAGVMHCIVMQVPVNKNGINPGAYLRSPNGGATYEPGQVVNVQWISDDDNAVTGVDIELSTDGGNAWTPVATGQADNGSYAWTVPSTATAQGRLRVVAHDADGHTGSDLSDANFTINPPSVRLQLQSASAVAPAGVGTNNGNASIEPGESRVYVTLNLKNIGVLNATHVHGALVSNTPAASLLLADSDFADLGPNAATANADAIVLALDASLACGAPISATLNLTYDGGSVALPVSIATGSPGGPGTPQTFSYAAPAVAIPDGTGSVNTTLNIPALSGTLADVNFRIDGTSCSTTIGSTTVGISHTYVGDLILTLTSPAGTVVTLIDSLGNDTNSGNNFCQTLLDDGASLAIQDQTAAAAAPFTGTFRPATPLSALNGQDATGVWTLNVRDIFATDSGFVRRWSIILTPLNPVVCTPPQARCAADISDDAGNPLPSAGPNNGVNEGDYNGFFNSFFAGTAAGRLPCDIADDAGNALPSLGSNSGVNEGDYNLFFNTFFGC
ncbi:hypothetical protein BH11PLA1_BH11PLA1_21180 [soil metagenome]